MRGINAEKVLPLIISPALVKSVIATQPATDVSLSSTINSFASAGSTFKRGKDYITAKLIDQCGLKGYNIGDAYVSEKHAGFIINKGNAKAEDILKLIEFVKQKVYEKFNVEIELEIEVLGED